MLIICAALLLHMLVSRKHAELLPPGKQASVIVSAPVAGSTRAGVELVDAPLKMVQSSICAGHHKVMYGWWQNAINGILGGAFISMGFFFACCVAGGTPGLKADLAGIQKLLLGITFPFGLCMVVLTGAELLTSSFSTVGAAWLAGSLHGNHWRAASNIVMIFVTNLVGALIMVGLAYGTGVLNTDPYRAYVLNLAEHKVHQEWSTAVTKGIVCNWLVSLAVFMAFAAQDVAGKTLAIWPPITAFVAMGMDHCVANMWLLPLGLLLGADYSLGDMILHNILPVTIGNFIGSQLCSAVFNTRFKRTFWEAKES